MTTRSKTLIFTQYRNSFLGPRRIHERLIPSKDVTIIEMNNLAPKWTDLYEETEQEIEKIKLKIESLNSLYKRTVLPGFKDSEPEEKSIEQLSNEITKHFQSCQKKINEISRINEQGQELIMTRNIASKLALEIQQETTRFRKMQSDYVKKLEATKNLFEFEHKPLESIDQNDISPFMQSEIETNEKLVNQREKEIEQIAKSINELSNIFKQISTLVKEQGTILDRIDYNLEQVSYSVKGAVKELEQGTRYQKQQGKKMIILLTCLVVLAFALILIAKKI